METRCRLCAEVHENNIQISEDSQFLSMLTYLFQLKFGADDKLPLSACIGCYEFVERIWHFKEQVDRAQILLAEVLNATNHVFPADNAMVAVQSDLSDIVMCGQEDKVHAVDSDMLKAEFRCVQSEDKTECETVDNEKRNKVSKKSKRGPGCNKRTEQSEKTEFFKEIESVNADGSVIPRPGIGSWNTYQWTCSECNVTFCEAEELRKHFSAIHFTVGVKYLCMDCPKIYSKYVSFVNHVKYHRPFLKYSCDICYKWYTTAKLMESHQSTHYEENPYQCTTCGKRFRVQSLLTLHSRSHLPSHLKNCYLCDQCPKKFGTRPNLMAHKRIHLGLKTYTCGQCGKSFIQKGNLDNHLSTHDLSRPFQCTVCDKSFKSVIRLKKHSSIHSGVKPHRCDVCGREFREKGTLKEHLRIHTGAMPFTCEFCGKSFRFKGVLTTHRRQHTGERPYSCTECQHHFTNWPNYNKHMKRRHGINTSVNCRTKQDIPPTGKPNRNPPGIVLATPQLPAPTVQVIESYSENGSGAFYPVMGLYGVSEDMSKTVL